MIYLNRDTFGKFIPKKTLIWKVILGLFLIAGLLAMLSYGLNKWNDMDRTIQKPIVVTFEKRPILVSRPKAVLTVISPLAQDATEAVDIKKLTPIEQGILATFGIENFQVARAVAKAESGLREDAFHANTNGTIDVGVFQVNSIHFKKPGCSFKELVIAESNIKCAYSIWKEQGWNPWVAFTNGNFGGNL